MESSTPDFVKAILSHEKQLLDDWMKEKKRRLIEGRLWGRLCRFPRVAKALIMT